MSHFHWHGGNSAIVCPSTPAAPWLAFTFLKASQTSRFGMLNGFALATELLPLPFGSGSQLNNAAPSIQLHYRAFHSVGSEEAPIEGLASVRRSNGTCSFPAFRFHEWLREIRREGISETRLTSLNSPKSRLVGYCFQPVFRHRLARCDHSLRTIHPSSWWKRFLTWERQ